MTMRQLGAEAAAKAKEAQRKASGAVPNVTPAPVSSEKLVTQTAQVPTPAAAKERESSDPSEEPEVTSAKTPAQLAAEGIKRTSVDKIESNSPTTTASPTVAVATAGEASDTDSSSPSSTPGKSTEEQLLDLRRQSTQTNQPSKLQDSISAEPDDGSEAEEEDSQPEKGKEETSGESSEDIEPPAAEAVAAKTTPSEATTSLSKAAPDAADEGVASEPSAPTKSHSTDSAAAPPSISSAGSLSAAGSKPRSHRGSSVEEADKAKIKEIEDQIKIEEHPDEDEEAIAEDEVAASPTKVESPPPTTQVKSGEEVKSEKPQETKAKDPDPATKSVED